MFGIEASAVTQALLWSCVGGTLLSVLFLWLEFHSGQELSRPMSGIFAAVFFGTAGILWLAGTSADVFALIGLLATFCLAVRVAHSQWVRHFAKRVAKPKLIWGLLLLVSTAFTDERSKPSCRIMGMSRCPRLRRGTS